MVQSTGALQRGDPVNIKTTITSKGIHEGDGTASSMGVLFMNKISETEWFEWGMGREYLRLGDVQDILGTSSMVNKMLALLKVDLNDTDDSTVTVTIGDTILLELIFNNSISLPKPASNIEEEGWAGERPSSLFYSPTYTRTSIVKKLILKHGNSLACDLSCLTQGALLNPLTPGGPNVDKDKDGLSDTREKGPDSNDSSFDGNSDGTPDYNQANVASFHTYFGDNYVTIAVPSGTVLSQLKVTDNPSPTDAPADAQFPWGFFDFSIDSLDLGEAITVTMILHNAVPVSKYYKYGMTPDNQKPHWYEFMYDGQTGAEINGNIITLHFADGFRGDEDITVNGSIKEPGGPAKSGTTMISELKTDAGVSVYPNPAGSFITLKVNDMPAGNYVVSINAITGRTMMEKVVEVCDSGQLVVIPTDRLPEGIYVVSLRGSGNIFKSKFIIK